jgi:hypothetical protein
MVAREDEETWASGVEIDATLESDDDMTTADAELSVSEEIEAGEGKVEWSSVDDENVGLGEELALLKAEEVIPPFSDELVNEVLLTEVEVVLVEDDITVGEMNAVDELLVKAVTLDEQV